MSQTRSQLVPRPLPVDAQPVENMVDVTGIEPVTPCLQSNDHYTM